MCDFKAFILPAIKYSLTKQKMAKINQIYNFLNQSFALLQGKPIPQFELKR